MAGGAVERLYRMPDDVCCQLKKTAGIWQKRDRAFLRIKSPLLCAMLQINTGKLFTRGVGRTNALRGVLYSNLRLPWRTERLETEAGTLLSTDGRRGSRAIVFEIEERIEAAEVGPGVLISHTVAPFLTEFSTVASFYLNILMSPDSSLVSRLIEGRAGFDTFGANQEFVSRFFDTEVYPGGLELEGFPVFVAELLALDRRTFLAAMRSIKSFVAGHHRIGDDLGLAYTLLVSSLESLAQDFDGHTSEWNDVEDRLRNDVDAALIDANLGVASAVRNAITSNENTRLSRRFRSFAESHITPDFFREGATGNFPIARSELPEALAQAYRLRSRYIHNIRELPDALTHPHMHWEMLRNDGRPHLTFQGLSRLARHVIISFVRQGRKVASEPYPYITESAGVTTVQMAPECWVWQPLADISHSRGRLQGFLEQLTSVMAHDPDAKLTDIRDMLRGAKDMLPNARPNDRAAFIALLALFNFKLHPDQRTGDYQEILERYEADSDLQLSENLIARTLLGSTDVWDIDAHIALHSAHCARSAKGKGLLLPRKLDALVTLVLAERCRNVGNVAKASELLCHAVENLPGHGGLLALEQSFDPCEEIMYWAALFPAPNEDEALIPE